MKDYLLDIAKHTVPLSAFVHLRVDGTNDATQISATETERHMVLMAKMHKPVKEFKGTFGIPNLALLNTLLNIPEYTTEKSKSTMTKIECADAEPQPATIHFENEKGDFKNDFRLMGKQVIDNLSPAIKKFNVKSWPIEFVPAVSAMQRLKYQTSAHPEEKTVTFKIEGGNITAQLGDASNHSGSFMFQSGVSEGERHNVIVPVAFVNSVFNLPGDKMVQMGDLGLMITIDSGLATYNYIFPTQVK